MPRNLRRKLRRMPRSYDAVEAFDAAGPDPTVVEAFAKKRRAARRRARRMGRLYWLGCAGFVVLPPRGSQVRTPAHDHERRQIYNPCGTRALARLAQALRR
ncbi:MAG TPA: hypothetical protein VL738_41790 [Dactylosporangium sp.]|nr:hypothetical protein [Dactylosporangium sp.]